MVQHRDQRDNGQKTLPWKRGARLRICDWIQLPKSITVLSKNGKPETVSGAACAHVLSAIESSCGDDDSACVGIKDIAARAKVSEAVAGRAIRALSADAAFVVVDGDHMSFHILDVTHRSCQRGRLASEYRPIWGNAIEFVPEEKRPSAKPHHETANPHGGVAKPHHESANPHGEGTITASFNRKVKPPPSPEWQDVDVFILGMKIKPNAWRKALDTARQNGVPSAEVLHLARKFASECESNGWQAGVFYTWLTTADPGQSDECLYRPVRDNTPADKRAAQLRELQSLPPALLDQLANGLRKQSPYAVGMYERGGIVPQNQDEFWLAYCASKRKAVAG